MRVATDIGGTFTDLVAFSINERNEINEIISAKSDTTVGQFEQGVLNVIDKAKLSYKEISFFVHGTTTIINALVEKKGVKVGLISTYGFRDTLEIGRGNRPDYFNLKFQKQKPFVDRHLRHEVKGRIDYLGNELEPLDMSELDKTIDYFKKEDVKAIAITLLNSYANPAHEEKLAAEIKSKTDIPVIISSYLTRQWREYERTSTTVLCAFVYPIASDYLNHLNKALKSKGFQSTPYIMQSNGGIDSLEATKHKPINMVESGPSSGFLGALEIGKLIGEKNILALDIGGTTAKCSLIKNGQVTINTDYYIERDSKRAGYPMVVPVVDLVEIGNGGGSIAWIDDFDKLHVGPQSAGSTPGPAAYGKGGTAPTTTDANVFLGRINPEYFCGGSFNADMSSVEKSLTPLSKKLNMSNQEVARGIIRVANHNMINALKLVSQNRGNDPRDFTLLCFGGGGAMHGCDLAKDLGIKKVIIPIHAGVFSAWGMLMSDLRRDYVQNKLIDFKPSCRDTILRDIEEIKNNIEQDYKKESIEANQIEFGYFLRLRYQGQEHTVSIEVSSDDLSNIEKLCENFHCSHQKEYTYRLDASVELVAYHLVATVKVQKPYPAKKSKIGLSLNDITKGTRKVDYLLDGELEALIIDGNQLEPDMKIKGPAVIEEKSTTVVIGKNQDAFVDAFGNIIINIQ